MSLDSDSSSASTLSLPILETSMREDAEKHLAQMEGKYRGLLEAAPDAMVVVNQDGRIVLLNVQAEKQFGYHRDELLGQPVTNIIPEGFAERLIADGLRTAAEALAQQIGTGIELTGCRKDGTVFPIEIMLSPLESAEGILVTAAIRNIGVRKEAEKHLAQTESRYRGLLEAAPDAMVVVNQDGRIVLLNVQAEKQFGYHRDELLGQPVTNIIPEGFAERLIADGLRTAAEALAQQIGTGIELTGCRKDGTVFPIEIMLSPLESAEGILVTAAIRDISVRKDAEKHLAQTEGKLRQAQKMEAVGQLTGGIAHDFNNLLAIILGNVELARDTVGLDADVSARLETAQRAAERGGELAHRLLAFSRRQTLLPQRVDINHLTNEVVKLLQRTLGATIAIETKLEATSLFAIVDPGQLENALLNLGVNARDAMPDGGTLSITTGHLILDEEAAHGEQDVTPGAYVTIAVTDNGAGMTDEVKTRAFEPFYTTKDVGKGSGLGLSMVYGFAKQSGGHVTIYSEAGHGTSIRLYLPVPRGDELDLAQVPARKPEISGGAKNVLVVEDNEQVRAIVVAMLEKLGFSVVQAANGHDALEQLGGDAHVDLLITDVIMPKGMSGIQLATKTREKWPRMPAIFISGYSEDNAALAEVIRIGGTLLSKPFSRAQLSDAIRKSLIV